MNVEGIKEQARRHEQKEEWKKALDVYLKAIERLEEDKQPDVSLHNRVGDLSVRVGEFERATTHYEQAVDLYVEAELPNNAIAVCKKIIRNVPARYSVYLKMGRIRAQQGFLTDARQCFLTFAERAQAAGGTGDALRALEELADLFPDDVEVHVILARALQQHGRTSDAISQLRAAHRVLHESGDTAGAESIEAKAREIDPSVDFGFALARESAAAAPPPSPDDMPFELGASVADDSFVEIAHEGFEMGSAVDASTEEPEAAAVEPTESWPSFSIGEAEAGTADTPDERSDPAETFPALSFGEVAPSRASQDEPSDEAPLPLLEWNEGPGALSSLDAVEEEESAPLPLLDDPEGTATSLPFDVGELDLGISEAPAAATPTSTPARTERTPPRRPPPGSAEALIDAGDLGAAEELIRDSLVRDPRAVAPAQRLVEVAFRLGEPRYQAEAYVELARRLELSGTPQQVQAVYQQVLQLDPENATARAALAGSEAAVVDVAQVASSEDYVDLGALIFGDEPEEKTTRFLVAYEEPTGDEQADFARMLSQFKAKIAENVEADDIRAHHDLGTAYKEMGLIDEAIEEFQAALRASRDHLPTYELLGQSFLDKGQPEAAVKSLERALALEVDVEDELLGIYYYLGRAYEQTGNRASAVEFYDRVFSLDINFMDVTERLRALR
jgi:tetratricopeptide (TPR) repeat protein